MDEKLERSLTTTVRQSARVHPATGDILRGDLDALTETVARLKARITVAIEVARQEGFDAGYQCRGEEAGY